MEEEKLNIFIELISSIVKRPAMYQVSNVEGLYLFIFGYITGSKSNILNEFNQEFKVFVNAHFENDIKSKKEWDWPRLIRFGSGSDNHSIELFGSLFKQFSSSFLNKIKLEDNKK